MSTATNVGGPGPSPSLRALAANLRWYLSRHPETSWEQFMADAVAREIGRRTSAPRRAAPRFQKDGRQMHLRLASITTTTIDDVQMVGWLDDRLDAYYASHRGFWTKTYDWLRTRLGW